MCLSYPLLDFLCFSLHPSISSLSLTFLSSHHPSFANWSLLIVSTVPWNTREAWENYPLFLFLNTFCLDFNTNKLSYVVLTDWDTCWCLFNWEKCEKNDRCLRGEPTPNDSAVYFAFVLFLHSIQFNAICTRQFHIVQASFQCHIVEDAATFAI